MAADAQGETGWAKGWGWAAIYCTVDLPNGVFWYRDVGLDNQGVNFDLANLILYGKANPVDAIELLGPYVQGIHAKDGLWPTNPKELGEEVPIGKGKVDFPRIIARLKELDYRGAVTIEREVSGPQQVEDVRAAKSYLEKLIG